MAVCHPPVNDVEVDTFNHDPSWLNVDGYSLDGILEDFGGSCFRSGSVGQETAAWNRVEACTDGDIPVENAFKTPAYSELASQAQAPIDLASRSLAPASARHRDTARADEKKRRRCDECGTAFENSYALELHALDNGHRAYVCVKERCGKSYCRRDVYTRHKRAHQMEMHACGVSGCTKKFRRKDHLTQHTRGHNRGSPHMHQHQMSRHSTTDLQGPGWAQVCAADHDNRQYRADFIQFAAPGGAESRMELRGLLQDVKWNIHQIEAKLEDLPEGQTD